MVRIVQIKEWKQTFGRAIEVIHERMHWVDCHEMLGALTTFNALFTSEKDDGWITSKVRSYMKSHLKQIINDFGNYRVTSLTLQYLSILCQKQGMVASYIRKECYEEMHIIAGWCHENKNVNPKNVQWKYYQHEDANKIDQWQRECLDKIDSMCPKHQSIEDAYESISGVKLQ